MSHRMTSGCAEEECTRRASGESAKNAGSCASEPRALALVSTAGVILGHGGVWVPGDAERDLVARAAAGEVVTGPLYRDAAGELYQIAAELSEVRPGAAPEALGAYGLREVRQVSEAARGLLATIRARDTTLAEAHRREIGQLTRMAAEIAHEVGNLLNAIALSVERLGTLEDPARRETALVRVLSSASSRPSWSGCAT